MAPSERTQRLVSRELLDELWRQGYGHYDVMDFIDWEHVVHRQGQQYLWNVLCNLYQQDYGVEYVFLESRSGTDPSITGPAPASKQDGTWS